MNICQCEPSGVKEVSWMSYSQTFRTNTRCHGFPNLSEVLLISAEIRLILKANRLVRSHVAKKSPSPELFKLTEFIVKVFVSSWFSIKSQPSITRASRHYFGIIQRSRYLEYNYEKIVDDTLQWNGFLVHPKNILVGMLLDTRPSIRTLAVKRI